MELSGPDWYSGTLYGDAKNLNPEQQKLRDEAARFAATLGEDSPVQQSDTLKPFLLDIGNWGLNYAYHKYYSSSDEDPEKYKHKKTEHPLNVIVIGAGISGLVAAYELSQSGHNVKILETQHRVGGRVKTIGESHFHKGLWTDAGAMRLPGTGEPKWEGPSHFMTDFYATKFELPLIPFVNSSPNGYYKFYGEPAIKAIDWDKDKKGYCNKFWPGWDSNLPEELKQKQGFDISAYFDATVAPVTGELRTWLKTDPNNAWKRWVDKWSDFSVHDFLLTTYEQLILKLKQVNQFDESDEKDLKPLKQLLPWPLEALVAFKTYTYVFSLDVSLVEFLRDSLGGWWKDPMHTFKDGLRMLPEAFMKKNKHGWNKGVNLTNEIVFGVGAYKIEYTPYFVKVHCRNVTTLENVSFKADKVIITLPINIIRGLTFSPPLPHGFYKAFENINIEPSTKIMVQCRTRFWQTEGIQGGFSKTNMPIGQLHYPSNPEFEVSSDKRGILMCYTWKSDALLFGSQPRQNAIAEVVEEISEIHPEIREEFEVGAIQSWYDDPNAQGAFTLLKPDEYIAMLALTLNPYQSIYFCGEALSYANGWIQGALESGLRSAYQVFSENEKVFK